MGGYQELGEREMGRCWPKSTKFQFCKMISPRDLNFVKRIYFISCSYHNKIIK